MKKTLILALAIAITASGCAEEETVAATAANESVAATATDKTIAYADTSKISFQTIDANSDGVISLTEAENQESLLSAFPTLDLDKSGDLNETEYQKFTALPM